MPGHRYDASSQAMPTQFEEDSMGGITFDNPAEVRARAEILEALRGGDDSLMVDSSVKVMSMGKRSSRYVEEDSLDSQVRRSARKKR